MDGRRYMDCEYETMGGLACAWAPGDCRTWCRSNPMAWAPTVIDIMDDVNRGTFAGFGIHVDLLSPDVLRCVLRQASLDEHAAEIYVEIAESLGIDGVFGRGDVMGRRRDDLATVRACEVRVSGLWKKPRTPDTDQPPQGDLEAWEAWEFFGRYMHGWDVKTLILREGSDSRYVIERVDGPSDRSAGRDVAIDRNGAISAIAKTMADDLDGVRMSHSKLFYKFEAETPPMSFSSRRGIASVFEAIAKHVPSAMSTFRKGGYVMQPMGPRADPCGGNVHVTLHRRAGSPPPLEIAWGACVACTFDIDTTNMEGDLPIKITVVTSW